ncbi:DNA-binding response regulator [Ktedonobacteria bacterium brp13]|nr:DNA-binding response regulator [Ktedonobacteria bacterium brp13]
MTQNEAAHQLIRVLYIAKVPAMSIDSNLYTKNRQPHALIVDDEPQIVDFLQMGFTYEGFQVSIATSGPEALRILEIHDIDLMILDIMLPGFDGLEVMRQARRSYDGAIIMLTAKENIDDRVAGLDLGADDYLTKPFAFKELMARARAVLRRNGSSMTDILTFHSITLDHSTREVKYNDQIIALTPREFDLLEFFLRHPRQVLTRDAILTGVWGYDYVGDDNIIEVYIRHLREKLNDNPPRLLQTVRGIGYALRG